MLLSTIDPATGPGNDSVILEESRRRAVPLR